MPFVIRWPGRIPDGGKSDALVSTLDIVPTIAAAVGFPLPSDRDTDGIDLMSHLSGGEPVGNDRMLFWSMGRNRAQRLWAVRDGNWKLLHEPDQKDRLYDLKEDISESRDLSGDRPELVARLRERVIAWRKSIGKP